MALTILHIEEDPEIRSGFEAFFSEYSPHTLINVATPREAAEAVAEYGPLIDVVLEAPPLRYPRREAGGTLRMSPNDELLRPLRATRILSITIHDERLIMEAGLRYVQKPFSMEELEAMLEVIEKRTSRLYELPITGSGLLHLGARIVEVNEELLRHFAAHPEELSTVHWRKFEEIVATLLARSGFEAELQRGTKDGGVDIVATRHDDFGRIMLLVQCKQTRNAVGVDVVRAMHGVTDQRRATMSMVATTSHFTPDAMHFQRDVATRLALRDYDALRAWLASR
ncbi:MAG TPA: restriction endonuclease [Thermoanaerobaculia bacterium]